MVLIVLTSTDVLSFHSACVNSETCVLCLIKTLLSKHFKFCLKKGKLGCSINLIKRYKSIKQAGAELCQSQVKLEAIVEVVVKVESVIKSFAIRGESVDSGTAVPRKRKILDFFLINIFHTFSSLFH